MTEKQVPVTKAVYIADDGMEFDTKEECAKYENNIRKERCSAARAFFHDEEHPEDFIRVRCDTANGEFPLKYWMYFSEDEEYVWYRLLSQKAVDMIAAVQEFVSAAHRKTPGIGDWVNLDYRTWDDDIYVETLDDCVKDFTHMLGKLGMTPAQAFAYEERRNNDARKWWQK